jgi:hypothetical protein
MTWVPLLLADPSPSLRILVLRDLLNRSEDDEEVCELKKLQEEDPLILDFLTLQNEDGSWRGRESGDTVVGKIRLTAQALMGLGYAGLGSKHSAVKRGAEYIFKHQQDDGSWPLSTQEAALDNTHLSDIKYHMIPLQTSLPLLGLAWAGYATDPRAERAYNWLIEEQLPQGGWPSGRHREKYIFAAGYRRLAHTKYGCRTNTTAAVSALALHPKLQTSQAARRGLDLLLAHEQRQSHTLGSGTSLEDRRVADNVKFVKELQGPYGLWEYRPHTKASRWVTFDILRSLSRLDEETDWLSMEPRTPFQPYPRKPRRF